VFTDPGGVRSNLRLDDGASVHYFLKLGFGVELGDPQKSSGGVADHSISHQPASERDFLEILRAERSCS